MEHAYQVTTRWTGNLGPGTSSYSAYSRSHEISAAGKGMSIPGSSDPAFRGDSARYNPEELLVGALAACHMLWVLHLCANAGIIVTEYRDESVGQMTEHADGSGEFTRVLLKPRMTIMDATRAAEAAEIHHRAHAVCALARSMNFEVACEPEVQVAGAG
ncbi:MAG TPA: OsmC family protein [Rhizomicrobium sp.]|nr:OsmC family protein [Rhizomicrobium sp.]